MSDDPWFHITIAASNLKVAVPDQFDALVRAVQLLADKENKTFLAAEGEALPRAQGRTNLVFQLRDRLVNCLEQRKNYQNRA
jgi:hypothetical protein